MPLLTGFKDPTSRLRRARRLVVLLLPIFAANGEKLIWKLYDRSMQEQFDIDNRLSKTTTVTMTETLLSSVTPHREMMHHPDARLSLR